MLLSEKYPDMKPIKEEKDGIMRGHESCPCCICGRMTEYIELNYEAYFCSDECIREMDRIANKR